MSAKPWFAWYPSDYRAKTAHLTFVESEAYRRMLEFYYERRGPLQAGTGLYRLCGAQDDAERHAIDRVSREFFIEKDGSLRHERCDQEISRSQAKHEAWVKAGSKGGLRSAQGRVEAGIKGGSTNPQPQSQSVPQPHITDSKALSDKSDCISILEFLNEKTGRSYRPLPANLELIKARLKEASADDIRSVIAIKCRQWAADEHMEKYLRPATLFGRQKFAQYLGELKNDVS